MLTGILAVAILVLVATHPRVQRIFRPQQQAHGAGSSARAIAYPAGRQVISLPDLLRRSRAIDLSEPAEFPLSVRVFKRSLDLVGASLGLILLSPVLFAMAVAIKLTSPGPVFFRQERVRNVAGGKERTFMMVKFRSMRQDAEAKTGAVWASKDDPRVTRVGAFLRKARLDELPQLWNVLRGEMSLVGPRPERPHFTSRLQLAIPAYEDRVVALKPGITGWAQVSCEYDETVDDVKRKLLYDLSYAAHLYRLPSYLKMEFRILFRTLMVVLTGRGAH